MVNIGHKIEDMEFDVYVDDDFKKTKLSAYKGKWIVLAFYPADFTFVCPTELEELAEMYDQFKKEGAEIISVSTDTKFVHKAWHDHSPAIKKIKYPMAADPTGKICRYFGTFIENEGISLRGTFIIDPEMCLKAADVHDNSIGRNSQEILRKLQASRFVWEHHGEVCPASWKPGQKTLKPGVDLVGKI
ncbi:MAG: redoxin domain-containing protein [Nanoarchaeota archaeon]|nr:redoxin domain-containing protein [Nanoarchaeota archaeon]